MKLIRFGEAGREKPGLLLDDGTRIDASAVTLDYDEAFFAGEGLDRLHRWLDDGAAERSPRVDADERLGAPIARPSKIVCVGLNYLDHAEESGLDAPEEPVLFMKASSSLSGPFDPIELPRGSKKTDWEVELAVVMGREARYVEEREAMEFVAGFAVMNDVSERDYQLERGGQWVKGKSCDTFSPLGPALVTRDEIEDVHALKMWLKVNGETKQDGSTSMLIFNVPVVVSYISRFMTLLPGDVISTGTPAGVGLGFKPPQFLKEGDVVELGIDGLGESRQEVAASPYE
ncbi:MAG: fumarylacetoacetate hydrolase family protein [Rhodothermales bacterium]